MPGLPTGTVTFLFTDIEGSTTLLQRLGDRRYAQVLAEHQRLLREAFAKRNGQEIDTQGDAFLVAFSRARDAVETAVAAQRALTMHAWPVGASLRVRMGLHTGEPVSETGGYVGLDLHRAARICSAGHGGQILLSDTVRALATPDLPPGVSLRDLGTHRLKDLRAPEHLFQVVHLELSTDFPPLKSLDIHPSNLPRQLTSFIGREREMAEVKGLLPTTLLLTLTGAGGSGKTRLALHVATDLMEDYADGVWLAQLASLSDPALVPKAVASALGIPEQPNRPLTETVVDYLRPRSVLLLLDNCEHLLQASAHLTDSLLQACPNLCILATSREALGIAGELTYRVPSLSIPDLKRLPPPEALAQYEAVRLFVERAAFSKPGFQITDSNAVTVAHVTHRLDGIPLAIELAAARVKALPLDVIAERLDDQFRLLTGGSRTGLPRQQTLRATLDWSYDLLLEPERGLLRSLSVFAGGFTLEAAEQICAGERIYDSDILDLLTRLVDKSLVVFDERDGQARYRLLESVRQYGRDKLQESGETNDIQRRHRGWFLALAERTDPKLRGPEQDVWLERLEAEHDNMRDALAWSKADEDGAEAWLRLAGSLRWFWTINGHWREGRRWLDEALAHGNEVQPATLLRVLFGAGGLAYQQGDYERAGHLAERGLALSQTLADRQWSMIGLIQSGNVAEGLGDYGRATKLHEEALALARELGNKWEIAIALSQLADSVRAHGDYERAAALLTESISLFREVGDQWRVVAALRARGIVSLRQRDYDRAAAFYAESLRRREPVKNRWVSYQNLEGLACVACARGHYEHAAILFGAAEPLQESLGSRRDPDYQAELNQYVDLTRTSLGARAFEAAWAEGRAMMLEQAVEYALAGEAG